MNSIKNINYVKFHFNNFQGTVLFTDNCTNSSNHHHRKDDYAKRDVMGMRQRERERGAPRQSSRVRK